MTAEKEPRTFTGAVGVADRRLALVSDDPRRIEAFRRSIPGCGRSTARQGAHAGTDQYPLPRGDDPPAGLCRRHRPDEVAARIYLAFRGTANPGRNRTGSRNGYCRNVAGRRHDVRRYVLARKPYRRGRAAARHPGHARSELLGYELGGFCRRCGADDRHHGRLRPASGWPWRPIRPIPVRRSRCSGARSWHAATDSGS